PESQNTHTTRSFVSFNYCSATRDLLSFPTRRSSDLARHRRSAGDHGASGGGARRVRGGRHVVRAGASIPLHFRSHAGAAGYEQTDRKSTRLNSSHQIISYAVFCLKKKNK